jgi:hypothetical protein
MVAASISCGWKHRELRPLNVHLHHHRRRRHPLILPLRRGEGRGWRRRWDFALQHVPPHPCREVEGAHGRTRRLMTQLTTRDENREHTHANIRACFERRSHTEP